MTESRSLWDLIRPLVYVGWTVATVRFAMEWFAPDQARWVGVYYVMPIALLVWYPRRFRGVGYGRLVLAMLAVGGLVWAAPNICTYTLAQYLGWEHGRFAPGTKSAAIAVTTLGKLGRGVGVGFATGVAGSLWMITWGTVGVWLPAWWKRRKS